MVRYPARPSERRPATATVGGRRDGGNAINPKPQVGDSISSARSIYLQTFSKTIHEGSISGAQRKGLFALQNNKLYVNSADSTFVFKPEGDFPELPANEHLTMTAARQLKFDVPPSTLIQIDGVGLVFALKRFDRIGKYRLLLEDMAQICGESSEDKYSFPILFNS